MGIWIHPLGKSEHCSSDAETRNRRQHSQKGKTDGWSVSWNSQPSVNLSMVLFDDNNGHRTRIVYI